jgi:deoxyribodipyrimidine photo-lyase
MMNHLIWLHDEGINLALREHPKVGRESEVFFVWDNDYFTKMRYGLRRLVFIYEALVSLRVPVYEGSNSEVCRKMMREYDLKHIFSVQPTNPVLLQSIQDLSAADQVQWLTLTPFVDLDDGADHKRFFRYWKKARRAALQPTLESRS